MICSKCGNRIPEWAHSVCYTCARTEKEHQRFGRRRPKRRKNQPGTKASLLPEVVTCSDCGQQVQTIHYASHRRQMHGSKPSTSSAPKARIDKGAGRKVPEIVQIAKRSRPPQRSAGHDRVVTEKEREEIARKVRVSRCRRRRKGINKLLQQVYRKPRFLSDILRDGGFSDNEICRLKNSHLDEYLTALSMRWEKWWRNYLSPKENEILGLRFSLKGRPAPSVEALAKKHRVAVTVIKWSEESAVRRLQNEDRKRELEEITVQTGRKFLTR